MKLAASSGVGDMIVQTILQIGEGGISGKVILLLSMMSAYCMRNASPLGTLRLDQYRPAQPIVSPTPASTAVGRSHQILYQTA